MLMITMLAKTNPKPPRTRCSMDNLANHVASQAGPNFWLGGADREPAGEDSDREGAAGGVVGGASCVADSMAIEGLRGVTTVKTSQTLLWPFQPCKQYFRTGSVA
jgi:hypothetical protein